MIRFSQFQLARAGRPLFAIDQLTLHAGERVALVGANGTGKSSLLAALRGELTPEQGALEWPPGWRVAWLAQELPGSPQPVLAYVVAADTAVATARRDIEAAEARSDGTQLAHAYDAWHEAGGPAADARAATLLDGLGFTSAQMEQPVDALSGGWRMRLNLARVLMAPADLLLLDEPTNHLDLDAVLWLEKLLVRTPAMQIIVSHDRDFLDRVATTTLAIEHGQLQRFSGGYTASEMARAEQASQRARQVEQSQQRAAHLQQFIDRFRAQATKARQAQSRLKALERMEVLSPLRAERGISFTFRDPAPGPDPLLLARGLACGHGQGPTVVSVPELTVRRGARIGILGRNGAGKTTLIRTLIGDLPELQGERVMAPALRPGYLAQQQIDWLDPNDSPLQHLQRLYPEARETELRGFLGQFGFSGEDALRTIGPLSGGEKTRLCLAALVRSHPGFLVLDEPTNHLDANTRDALAEALADFDGALLLVSHDRYLLRASVDQFMLIDGGVLRPFDGDLDDYADWLAAQSRGDRQAARPGQSPAASATGQSDAPVPDAAEQRRERARQRQALQPLRQELRRIEGQMEKTQSRLTELDRMLGDSGLYADAERATRLGRERTQAAAELAAQEDRWLEVSTQIESRNLSDQP